MYQVTPLAYGPVKNRHKSSAAKLRIIFPYVSLHGLAYWSADVNIFVPIKLSVLHISILPSGMWHTVSESSDDEIVEIDIYFKYFKGDF